MRRWRVWSRAVRGRTTVVPAQEEAAPSLRHDTATLPGWALAIALVAGVVGVVAHVKIGPGGPARWIALAIAAFLVGVTWSRARTAKRSGPASPRAWAHGPWGRLVIGAGLMWHVLAVGVWLSPDYDTLRPARSPARAFVRTWLVTTQTDQGWGMFAPNPPQHNRFLQVLVTDAHGEVWDLQTDLYSPERRVFPFVWNDRMRKMNRVLLRKRGSRYRKWVARHHCRQWALTHDGEVPQSVRLVHRWYRIPTPEQTRDKGWYDPVDLFERTGKSRVVHTERCAKVPLGQPSPEMRRRHGLPEGDHVPWIRRKKKRWESRSRR